MAKKVKIAGVLSCVLSGILLFAQRGVTVTVQTSQGQSIELYRQYRALVIGVSEYQFWPGLPNAVQDAREVASVLKAIGFETTIIENPTSAEFKRHLNTLVFQQSGKDDGVLIYFAGHGETMKLADGTELGYIIAKDCPLRARDPLGFADKAISMETIQTLSLQLKSKHLLALFDSCFSGSIFSLERAAPADISYKTAQPVRQFITAGSADETVPDKSVFKDCFLEALKGEADANQDGYVTGSELGLYLESKVVNYTRSAQHPQYGKIRNLRLDKGDFVFILAPMIPKSARKPESDIASQIELEFWQSTKESNKAEAYTEYLNKYPQGVFSTLAKQKVDELARGDAAKKSEDAPAILNQDTVATVTLIQLPGPMVREYNEKTRKFSVSDVPADIKVSGQITLVYSVAPDGKISVESIKKTALDIVPAEKEEFVKGLIIAAVQAIVLPPPRDKSGNRVIVKNWPVSYQIGRYQDRLVLNIITF